MPNETRCLFDGVYLTLVRDGNLGFHVHVEILAADLSQDRRFDGEDGIVQRHTHPGYVSLVARGSQILQQEVQ